MSYWYLTCIQKTLKHCAVDYKIGPQIPFIMILKFFCIVISSFPPSRHRIYFHISWIWALPLDLLWPIKCENSYIMGLKHQSLKRPCNFYCCFLGHCTETATQKVEKEVSQAMASINGQMYEWGHLVSFSLTEPPAECSSWVSPGKTGRETTQSTQRTLRNKKILLF